VVLPGAAEALRPAVPVMLAGQVAGVALTIPYPELSPILSRPRPLIAALVVQWTALPLLGLGLYELAGGDRVGQGAFITAASPAEITSALVVVVAGGAAATATTLMSVSVAVGCVLTPLWLLLLGHAHLNPGLLVSELVVSVALPLIVGVALRTRYPQLGNHHRRFLDLAGLSLLLVVFVGTGYARPLFESSQLAEALLFAVVLVAGGAAVGLLACRLISQSRPARLALAYPIAMREFGIATAVAPRAGGFGGVYGVIMMLTAALTAMVVRRQASTVQMLRGPDERT
jgi:bile acid:Na+ symporter, BASS family